MPKKLPAALAKRASAAAKVSHDRTVKEARELVALVKERKADVTAAFYDIGEACAKLKEKRFITALGRKSFAELCEKDLGLSATTASRLVDIVRSMSRTEALEMGQQKAFALASLAGATPEADTPAELFKKHALAVPGGKAISPRSASAKEIERAAKKFREEASARRPRRGRSTTEEERELAASIEKRLHAAGAREAKVTAVATKPGHEANLRFEGIPVSKLAALRKALG